MRKFRVAIVGAGPAGYFSAQAFQMLSNEESIYKVDLFERLPTPWGLVRSGVAPDHPKIKSVSKVFEKISDDLNFRLFANVEVGQDITLESLMFAYDAVILAVGTPTGKSLGIPGEKLTNCWTSAEFVSWYNCHPEHVSHKVNLSGQRAIVIGAGNVAMDIARILVMDPNELGRTDIADHALDALKMSKIREVWVCARRGAEFASFTASELRELPDLVNTNVVIDGMDIDLAKSRAGQSVERHIKSNLEAMETIAALSKVDKARTLEFHFEHIPLEIRGKRQVESVIFSSPKGELEVKADLVITAIGYQPDRKLPIEIDGNRIANRGGLVSENLYVVGWAKRGPTGVIGTNKSDATDVVKIVAAKLSRKAPKESSLADELLRNTVPLDLSEWRRINENEIARGLQRGRPRVKFATIEEMITIAKSVR